jgi:hypothetical protein
MRPNPRPIPLVSLLALAVAAGTPGLAAGQGQRDADPRGRDGDEHGSHAIGLWGDLPYSDLQATVGVPNLIADNNLCDVAPDPAEWSARNQANIAWLRETFDAARARRSAAIMLIAQANPGWDETDTTRAPARDPRTLAETNGPPDGYREFLTALREEVIAFERPVAYVHGDSRVPSGRKQDLLKCQAGAAAPP